MLLKVGSTGEDVKKLQQFLDLQEMVLQMELLVY